MPVNTRRAPRTSSKSLQSPMSTAELIPEVIDEEREHVLDHTGPNLPAAQPHDTSPASDPPVIGPDVDPCSSTLHKKTSKTLIVLDMLRCEAGATIAEIMAATNWQAHSVRGFLSGTVRRKLGLHLTSETDGSGIRRYRTGPASEPVKEAPSPGEPIDLPPFGRFGIADMPAATKGEQVGS